MSEFRVRPTDDNQPTWCVADGKNVRSTEHYIDRFGKVVDICSVFSTEQEATEAINKYHGRRNMNKQELETKLEQCRKDKAASAAEEKRLLAEIKQKRQEVPIISWGTFGEPNDRVIINLNPHIIRIINQSGIKQIVICSDGFVGYHRGDHKVSPLYRDVTPIFGSFVSEED